MFLVKPHRGISFKSANFFSQLLDVRSLVPALRLCLCEFGQSHQLVGDGLTALPNCAFVAIENFRHLHTVAHATAPAAEPAGIDNTSDGLAGGVSLIFAISLPRSGGSMTSSTEERSLAG